MTRNGVVGTIVGILAFLFLCFGMHSCNADLCEQDALRYKAVNKRMSFNGCVLQLADGRWIDTMDLSQQDLCKYELGE